MTLDKKLNIALLFIRLGAGAFLAVWASLKFYRPEWMANVFKGTYGIATLKKDSGLPILGFDLGYIEVGMLIGSLQLMLAALFIIGFCRTQIYAAAITVHGTGILATVSNGALWNYTKFPNNLLWTSVVTLCALVALFILRNHDGWTIDGLRKRNST